MKRNMILLFQNSDDDMQVDTLPALLTLHEEHAKAILGEIALNHPHKRATTISVALSSESFAKKPDFLPLSEELLDEFPTPDYITALIRPHDKTFTLRLTYESSDQGIGSSEIFYSSEIAAKDLTSSLLTEEDMEEWLMNDCNDTAYVKKALGEDLFKSMLEKMQIEEEELQQT